MPRVGTDFEVMRVLAHGEHTGIATAHQMPDQECRFVNFVADTANAGVVCVGITSGVTLSANSDTTTAGFQLTAKAQSGWLPCQNLQEFYIICTSTADHVSYICVG